jgi:hypothetical protein
MKHWLYLFFFLLVTRCVSAQDSTIRYLHSTGVILKLAPLSLLLDPDATIQGAVEVRISRQNSVQAEIGYGHKGLSVITDQKENFVDWSIWRFRSEWRHYTNHYRTNNRQTIHIRSNFPLGNYIAIEGFAKQINGTKEGSFTALSAPVSLESISRFVLGSHVKWGRQIAIPGESTTSLSRVLLDLYIGVGLRYGITQTTPDERQCGCGFLPDRFQQGRSPQLSVAAGLKLGFGL